MASVFEELLALDRPFVDFKLRLNGKEFDATARRLSAADADALDAFFADEYARLIVQNTEPNGELDRVERIYAARPRQDLMDQILGTRAIEIQRNGLALAGIDAKEIAKKSKDLEGEALDAYEAELEEMLKPHVEQAKAEIAADYESKSTEELSKILAQVNINIKAMQDARYAQQRRTLFYTLYDADKTPFFTDIEFVNQLSKSTIESIVSQVDLALLVGSDLPFESPPAHEPDGQQPSPRNSAAGMKAGGKRTKTTPSASKPSTTP